MFKKQWMALLLCASLATAQAMTTTFPEGSTELTPEALHAALAGKSFRVQPEKGGEWRLQYKDSGYFFINVGSHYSDSGQWSVKDSSLCSEGQKIAASCNPMRLKDGKLYLKRDNGEVVEFVPQ